MTNKNAIECIIKGIKCDHCNFRDDAVKLEDYKEWLNKPCPHCGFPYAEPHEVVIDSEITLYQRVCGSCRASTGLHLNDEEAVKAWNRRADK